MKKKGKMIVIILLSVILIGLLAGLIFIGAAWRMGPFGFLRDIYLRRLPGNAEAYHLENVEPLESSPLAGKRLCFLGSSVTNGDSSLDVSFADYIPSRNGCSYVKEAVGGTTLVDNGNTSYIQRMLKNIDPSDHFDVFICQLSTNDATQGKPMGAISESTDLDDFDTSTIAGAMEYIICYAKETWDCPVVFYTGTKYDSAQYEQMVELLYQLQAKWDIGIIDLWNSEAMNAVSETDYALYMADPIHPTQAGYLLWWTPVMEQYLYDLIGG